MSEPRTIKWVLCPLCADVLYAGPGPFPVPRECECRATLVMPMPDKGHIKWDQERYAAAGYEEPELEFTDEKLDPSDVIKPERPRSIDEAYTDAFKRLEQTGEA